MNKEASSQAAWALLAEGVARARVEAHRLQHLMNRAQRLVDGSEEKDHLYQVAGDVIIAMPERLDQVLVALDRTALALSKLGEEFLSSRLPLSDREMVDEAVEAAFGPQSRESDPTAARVADAYAARRASDAEG